MRTFDGTYKKAPFLQSAACNAENFDGSSGAILLPRYSRKTSPCLATAVVMLQKITPCLFNSAGRVVSCSAIAGLSVGKDTPSSFRARMSKRCHSRSRFVGSGSFSNVRHAVSRWDLSHSGSPEVTASTACCVNPVVIAKRCGNGATPSPRVLGQPLPL